MSDQDPSVRTWGEAIDAQLSTSAAARIAEAELEELRKDYNAVLLERDEALAENERLRELASWKDAVVDMLRENEAIRAQVIRERNDERRELKSEIERLRARLKEFGYAG